MGRPEAPPARRPPFRTPSPNRRKMGRVPRVAMHLVIAIGVFAGLEAVYSSGIVPPGVWAMVGIDPAEPVPAAGPPVGVDEGVSRLRPSAVPRFPDAAFAFRALRDGDQPVTWSPCRAIRVVVRPDNAPAGGAAAVERALQELSDATGLAVVDEGPTDEAPSRGRPIYQPDRYGDRWAPVLIAWGTPAEAPEFADGAAVGTAAPMSVIGATGVATYVSGFVYLDPRSFIDDGPSFGYGTILHELGHLAGLTHIQNPNELMWGGTSTLEAPTTYQIGDLTGLAELGQGPCHTGT